MLKDNDLQVIAKRIGLEADKLKDAISSDKEEELEIKEVTFFDADELNTLKENVKKDGYKDGKKSGVEMEFKRLRELFGVELEGKDMEKLINKVVETKLSDAKVEPNKKISELEETIGKLRTTITDIEQDRDNKISDLRSKMNLSDINSQIRALMPNDDETLTQDDLTVLYKAMFRVEKSDDGLAIYDVKTNELLKDKMQKNINLSDSIDTFLEGRKIKRDGRGGGDKNNFKGDPLKNIKTNSEFNAYCEDNEITLADRATILTKVMQNEGFDLRK